MATISIATTMDRDLPWPIPLTWGGPAVEAITYSPLSEEAGEIAQVTPEDRI